MTCLSKGLSPPITTTSTTSSANERGRARQLGSAVFISDLAAELKVPIPKIHDWIQKEVIAAGHGSLDEGHWPTATEAQRAAAIEHLGSKRLLIRF